MTAAEEQAKARDAYAAGQGQRDPGAVKHGEGLTRGSAASSAQGGGRR